MTTKICISGENIEATYYKKPVLHGISFDIKEKEIVTFIGPNGAGKSTLLKVIFGLLTPTKGSVFFRNINITGRNPYINVKEEIGYFIQGGEIFTNMTVLENLQLAKSLTGNTSKDSSLREIYSLFPVLNKLEIKKAGFLSGGERQMLALGMLLMRKPVLLLLDEPTAGLGPALAKNLFQKIKEINNKNGISVLLVEQNIKQALSISSRTYLLKNGKVVNYGTSAKILQEENLINNLLL